MIEQQLISPAASIQSCIGIDTTFAPDNLSDSRICLDTLKLMGTLVTLGTPIGTVLYNYLSKTLQKGTVIDVGDPLHPDSVHTHSFSGTVDKVFLDRVRVLDMEEKCWDVAFDEITAIYP